MNSIDKTYNSYPRPEHLGMGTNREALTQNSSVFAAPIHPMNSPFAQPRSAGTGAPALSPEEVAVLAAIQNDPQAAASLFGAQATPQFSQPVAKSSPQKQLSPEIMQELYTSMPAPMQAEFDALPPADQQIAMMSILQEMNENPAGAGVTAQTFTGDPQMDAIISQMTPSEQQKVMSLPADQIMPYVAQAMQGGSAQGAKEVLPGVRENEFALTPDEISLLTAMAGAGMVTGGTAILNKEQHRAIGDSPITGVWADEDNLGAAAATRFNWLGRWQDQKRYMNYVQDGKPSRMMLAQGASKHGQLYRMPTKAKAADVANTPNKINPLQGKDYQKFTDVTLSDGRTVKMEQLGDWGNTVGETAQRSAASTGKDVAKNAAKNARKSAETIASTAGKSAQEIKKLGDAAADAARKANHAKELFNYQSFRVHELADGSFAPGQVTYKAARGKSGFMLPNVNPLRRRINGNSGFNVLYDQQQAIKTQNPHGQSGPVFEAGYKHGRALEELQNIKQGNLTGEALSKAKTAQVGKAAATARELAAITFEQTASEYEHIKRVGTQYADELAKLQKKGAPTNGLLAGRQTKRINALKEMISRNTKHLDAQKKILAQAQAKHLRMNNNAFTTTFDNVETPTKATNDVADIAEKTPSKLNSAGKATGNSTAANVATSAQKEALRKSAKDILEAKGNWFTRLFGEKNATKWETNGRIETLSNKHGIPKELVQEMVKNVKESGRNVNEMATDLTKALSDTASKMQVAAQASKQMLGVFDDIGKKLKITDTELDAILKASKGNEDAIATALAERARAKGVTTVGAQNVDDVAKKMASTMTKHADDIGEGLAKQMGKVSNQLDEAAKVGATAGMSRSAGGWMGKLFKVLGPLGIVLEGLLFAQNMNDGNHRKAWSDLTTSLGAGLLATGTVLLVGGAATLASIPGAIAVMLLAVVYAAGGGKYVDKAIKWGNRKMHENFGWQIVNNKDDREDAKASEDLAKIQDFAQKAQVATSGGGKGAQPQPFTNQGMMPA